MSVKTPPPLPADLTAGLRRLKLATIRQLAPELLLTAKTQRWAPEEVLRTLIEAEVAARDASNERARLKAAGFPVLKTIEEFDLTVADAVDTIRYVPPGDECDQLLIPMLGDGWELS